MEAYKNPALTPEERARDLLSRMTLEEKVAQINIIRGTEFHVNSN
jgi:beta-glucosidase